MKKIEAICFLKGLLSIYNTVVMGNLLLKELTSTVRYWKALIKDRS